MKFKKNTQIWVFFFSHRFTLLGEMDIDGIPYEELSPPDRSEITVVTGTP